MFGITWVTESHVVTVSRDQHIKLWAVDAGSSKFNTMPLQSVLPFKVEPTTFSGTHQTPHGLACISRIFFQRSAGSQGKLGPKQYCSFDIALPWEVA